MSKLARFFKRKLKASEKSQLSKYIFCAILVAFLGKEISYIIHHGEKPLGHADGMSESLARETAENFITRGFTSSAGLQIWPNFPIETEFQILKDKGIYTHYFPGPGYVLFVTMSLFGTSDTVFQWTRLVPLFCIFFSLTLLILICEQKNLSSLRLGKSLAGSHRLLCTRTTLVGDLPSWPCLFNGLRFHGSCDRNLGI